MSKKPKPIRTPGAALERCLNEAIVREATLKYELGALRYARAAVEKGKTHERKTTKL